MDASSSTCSSMNHLVEQILGGSVGRRLPVAVELALVHLDRQHADARRNGRPR